MSWKKYTVCVTAVRPKFMAPIPEPEIIAKMLHEALDWMNPEIAMQHDTYTVRLTMPAPSAEGALHHVRGSFKSTLYGTDIPAIGTWPLASISVDSL